MKAAKRRGLVLAVHPTSRGFGWVVFENPLLPVDWGLSRRKTKRSTDSLERFEQLLDRYSPSVAVFEQFQDHPARRVKRIQEVCRKMIEIAGERDIETPIYSRDTIRECFESAGAKTRYDIALSVANHIEIFRNRLPRERRSWEGEDARQSLFDAAALALTYYAVNGQQTLNFAP